MARSVDVVVIGAGIAGAATARAVAAAGRSTLLVEQFAPGHARGSSHGATRIFRLGYGDERYVRMAQASLEGWRELEEESGEALVLHTGCLDIGEEARQVARALSACGVGYEELRPAEVAARFGIRVDEHERVLFQPDGGVTLAEHALQAFLAGAATRGAELLTGAAVSAVRPGPRAVEIVTPRETIRARAAVVTAGAWAPRLLGPAGIDLPVIPTRETVAYVELPHASSLPSVIDYTRIGAPAAGEPFRPGVAGFALPAPGIGLKVGLHHAGPTTDPDDDPPPTEPVVRWAERWAQSRVDGAGAVLKAETCIYTNTADESFVLERHGRIVVGSACSGHGFKFAPLIGRTLAALAADAVG